MLIKLLSNAIALFLFGIFSAAVNLFSRTLLGEYKKKNVFVLLKL